MGKINGARARIASGAWPGAAAAGVAACLCGCIPWAAFEHESATLAPYCAGHDFVASVDVVRPDGPLAYNGHMLGFDRAVLMFNVKLAQLPSRSREFKASEIRVESIPTTYNLTGGGVTVDLGLNRLVVDLQVDGQPFKGNGQYPLDVRGGACPAR